MSSLSFQDKLFEIYQKNDKIAPLIEGLEKEIPPQRLENYYVKLKTIIKQDYEERSANYETISGRKQEIEVENLFGPLESEGDANQDSVKKLLIVGGAGVGKSTLMQYIAFRWSKGELWKDKFDYVYRVSLKTLLNREWKDGYEHQQKQDHILKCFVHYHLVTGTSNEKGKEIRLEDLAWLDKKDRILLLLDGFDEVANRESDEQKRLFEEIWNHQNLILTSRPNAITKDMAQKFERTIENIGFDDEGVNQYLSWHFQANEVLKRKGEELQEFLEKNASAKDICKIPVSLAMTCFIWSGGNFSQPLSKDSKMSDLYDRVVDRLGSRYSAKKDHKKDQEDQNNPKELTERLKGGKNQLDELRVLQHVAYKGLTGGGIGVSDEERVDTLIIPGMSLEGIKTKISIQDSIDDLFTELNRKMPVISQVYKYGLLRPEGMLVKNKELSDTDLQSHNFSFIHLSFQEFLTAQYFAERLIDDKNQANFANFIAQHRNEPRYFLTLKFLAGILSTAKENQDDNKASKALGIFWDAIMCNVDGVLEFGVETKVTLLMHLLSQTAQEDARILNKDIAENLIDSVVLGDISGWSTQLKESGYSSENIREGLIKYFAKNNVNWFSDKSLELQKKLELNIDIRKDSHPSLEDIMEIIKAMINKFSEPQQNEIVSKACELLKDYNKEKWFRTKNTIDFILAIRRKTKLKIEFQKEEEILNSLLVIVHDHNLKELSQSAISEILHNSPHQQLLVETVLKQIKNELEILKSEKEYSRLDVVSQILLQNDLGNHHIAQNAYQFLILFLEDSDGRIRLLASINVIEFLTKNGNKNLQLVNNLLDILMKYLFSKQTITLREEASKQIVKLIKISSHLDPQLAKTTTEKFIEQMKKCYSFQQGFYDTIVELIKIHLVDGIQYIQYYLDKFLSLHKTNSTKCPSLIITLIQTCGNNDIQLIRETINSIIQMIRDSKAHKNVLSFDGYAYMITELIKLAGENKPQLIRDTIDMCSQLFYNPDGEVNISAAVTIIELISANHKSDIQMTRFVLNSFTQLLKGNPRGLYTIKVQVIGLNRLIGDMEFTQGLLNILIPSLKNPDNSVPVSMKETIVEVIQSSGNNQTQLVQNNLDNLTSLLVESQGDAKFLISRTIVRLMNITKIKDSHLAKEIFEALTPLLKTDSPDKVQEIFFVLRIDDSSEKTLAHNIFTLLLPFLKDSCKRNVAIDQMASLMQEIGSDDVRLAHDIWNTIHPILIDEKGNIRDSASKAQRKFMEIRGERYTQPIRDLMNSLISLLDKQNPFLKKVAFHLINHLMKSDTDNKNQIFRDVLDHLTPLLYDSDEIIKNAVSTTLVKLFKISGHRDTELARTIIDILVSDLKYGNDHYRRMSILKEVVELSELTGLYDNQIFTNALNNSIPFLTETLDNFIPFFKEAHDSPDEFASQYIITLARISSNKDGQLAKELFETLSPFFKPGEERFRSIALKGIIEVMRDSGKYDVQLTQEIFEISASIFQTSNYKKDSAASSMIQIITLTKNPQFLREALTIFIKLIDSDYYTAARHLQLMVTEVFLQHPEDLPQYFNHPSKEFRGILISSLLQCLKDFVGKFQILNWFFQNYQPPLTLQNVKDGLFYSVSKKSKKNIELYFEKPKDYAFDSEKHFSELKSLLLFEINQINSLKANQIIELAAVIIAKVKISADDPNQRELIEAAKETLNIQIDLLKEDGLQWIRDNHEKLVDLSPEMTKCFDRRVCVKLLEHERMTPLEESLLIKFIKQGLTISLKMDKKDSGEIIFEGKRHKLKGDNIKDALEKIAKTIIDQQQDLLAFQYKQCKPIFAKSNAQGGVKEAAVDYQDVRSIVDTRHKLQNDSWLLTILRSGIDSKSNIILLEKRSAFGDHFIFRFNDEKTFRLYPKKYHESKELKEIFGSYRYREFFYGKVLELTEEVGQKLLETKSTKNIDNVEGKELTRQIYFQQDLLREGNGEDRGYWTEKELETKLNDNRKLLEKKLGSLNLADSRGLSIEDYYQGFVSTFSAVFTSSQAIANGQLKLDTGTDYFSLLNHFIQIVNLDPLGIGDKVATTLDAVNGYLKEEPMKRNARCVTKIAADGVELNALAGETVLRIIKKPTNRQRIFDAKEETQPDTKINRMKKYFEPMVEQAKDLVKQIPRLENFFLEEIKTTPAFRLGEADANQIIRKWIELVGSESKSTSKPPRSENEKCKFFVKALSAAAQPNQQNDDKKGDQCAMF